MPMVPYARDLTGLTRYRSGFRGTLVLQVEEKRIAYYAGRLSPFEKRTPVYEHVWRDAKVIDLRALDWFARHAADDLG